jgi:hypothetical protein
MIQHRGTILCEKSVIDKESNNVSLPEVLDQVDVLAPAGLEPVGRSPSPSKSSPCGAEPTTTNPPKAKDASS